MSLQSLLEKITHKHKERKQSRVNEYRELVGQIAAVKDYQGRYVFAPTVAPGVPSTLLGYPVLEAEDMPEIASGSFSIAVGDFSRAYEIVDRIGTRVLRDPFSNKPFIGLYCTRRVGGTVINSEAIKLLKFAAS